MSGRKISNIFKLKKKISIGLFLVYGRMWRWCASITILCMVCFQGVEKGAVHAEREFAKRST